MKTVAVRSPDDPGIDGEGGGRVGVADLVLDVGDVEAGGEQLDGGYQTANDNRDRRLALPLVMCLEG